MLNLTGGTRSTSCTTNVPLFERYRKQMMGMITARPFTPARRWSDDVREPDSTVLPYPDIPTQAESMPPSQRHSRGRPLCAARRARVFWCLAALPAIAASILVSGCFVSCGLSPYGYNVFATIQDTDGLPISGVAVRARMEDRDRVKILGGLLVDGQDPRTDEAGELGGRIGTLFDGCATGLDALLGLPPMIPDPPLSDPAFVILLFPETGEEISIEVTEAMITRNPERAFDDLDLGVVTVPAQ